MRLLACAALLAACGSLGPRELQGPGAGAPAPALAALRRPGAGRIVAAERGSLGGRLVLVDEAGRRVADLTPPPEGKTIDITPAWSPDGRWVAFASSRGRAAPEQTSLWLIDVLARGKPVRLTDGDGVDLSPSFSPDSRTVVFASTRGGGGLHLWKVAVAGGAPRRLTDGPGQELEPSWAHHGDRIAFRSLVGGASRLMTIGAEGGPPAPLTEGPGDTSPAWSPDDRRVAFVAPADGRDDSDLWLVDADGGNRRHLVDDYLADEREPRFSEDGRFLIASSVVRAGDRHAWRAWLVVADLSERPPRLRVLADEWAAPRLGSDVAPVPLDARVLAGAIDLRDEVRRAARNTSDRE